MIRVTDLEIKDVSIFVIKENMNLGTCIPINLSLIQINPALIENCVKNIDFFTKWRERKYRKC